MLQIKNFDAIRFERLKSKSADWSINEIHELNASYRIKILFHYGLIFGKKNPKQIWFKLNRNKNNFGQWILENDYKPGLQMALNKEDIQTKDNLKSCIIGVLDII